MICCSINKANRSIDATLQFQRDQLLYDIGNYAYIEGSVMNTGESHLRHMVQDIVQGGNVDRVTRVLNLAHSAAEEMLYPYTKREVSDWVLDDVLVEPEVYKILMTVPDSFSQTTLNFLEKLIHDWLVCMVIADWFSMTYPDKASVWYQKTEALKEEVENIINTRRSRVRIVKHPF